MQLELVEKKDNFIKIGIKDADTTIITPIIERLDKNKNVKIVRYIETHPDLNTPELYVEMYNGDPVEAIIAASKEVSDYFAKIA